MRSLALFLVIIVAATAAKAEELPKRKPGLWELRIYSDVPQLKQAAEEMVNTAKMCIDDATDEKLAAAYDPCDPPLFFAFYTPQFTKEVVCKIDLPDFKAMSRATITFTGNTAYRIAVRTDLEPAPKGKGDLGGGREGKWLGACPADMQPGDIIMGDNPKLNVFDKMAHPDE
jgi:hypothetical protein